MANKKISQLTPKGSALAGTDLLEVSVFNGATYDTKSLTGANVVSGLQPTLFSGTNIKTINSTSLLGSGDIAISTGLTVGTTPITSGTVGRVLFQGTGNVVQQDAGFIFDSTAKTLTNYGKGGFNSNTSFGVTAGQSNISGIQNSFFGFETLTNNQTGSYNTAMGYTALRNTTGIGYNTAIGWGAGVGVSSGFGNTLLGYGAGGGITTGNNNTIIGVNIATLAAGTLNNVILADGGGNIAIRKDANHFVGVGYSATATLGAKLDIKAQGALSTDIAFRVRNSANSADIIRANGLGDVYIGIDAGRVNTATQNTFVGYSSGYSNTSGQSNSVLGNQALALNVVGNNNTAIGFASLRQNVNNSNTAIGSESLRYNTSGSANTAIGVESLITNTIGIQNTATGASSLYYNTSGNNNVGDGFGALIFNSTGSNNIAVGHNSGKFIADGVTSNAISNNSVFLGQATKALANNQTNQIVIGYDAIGAGSNTATIGNTSIVKTILRGTLNAANLPTSAVGLVTGDIWNNLGILTIV